MADDLLPLLGYNVGDAGDNNDSDSESISSRSSDADGDELIEEDHGDADGRQGRGGRHRANEERGRPRAQSHNFDTSLPGTHSYLGDDLEDVRGRTVHEDNAVVTIPLVPLPGVVLVPGEVIPLHLFQQTLIAAIRRLVDTDKTFGVVTYSCLGDLSSDACFITVVKKDRRLPITLQVGGFRNVNSLLICMEPDHSPGFSEIGCTAELFSIKNEVDDQAGLSVLRALARGRQRFKVIDMHRDVTGILMSTVRILPEVSIPRCLGDVRPQSHSKFCSSPTEQDDVVKTAVDRQGNVIKSVNMMINRQVDRFTAGYMTRWPPWVYKLYDADLLKDQIVKELYSWNETLHAGLLPSDAMELSYWVAKNLPLDNAMRMHLLGVSCPIYRLRSELAIMKKCAVLSCKSCMKQIARKEDMFSMATEGPMGAYVNPGGVVHETLTLYKASHLRLIGHSSTEHSWFPGYAWTIAQCQGCASHMGWRFTATTKKLTPQKFWGLCRSSLVPTFRKNAESAEETGGGGNGGGGREEEEDELILEGW